MIFKGFLFLVLTCMLSFNSLGQNNELHLKAFLNNSFFRGTGAQAETYSGTPVNQPKSPFVVNPYGTNGKIGYGVGLAFQRNTKSNLLFGVTGSIEKLTSQISSSNGIIYNNRGIAGRGSNELNLNYLNLQPYIGLKAVTKLLESNLK